MESLLSLESVPIFSLIYKQVKLAQKLSPTSVCSPDYIYKVHFRIYVLETTDTLVVYHFHWSGSRCTSQNYFLLGNIWLSNNQFTNGQGNIV